MTNDQKRLEVIRILDSAHQERSWPLEPLPPLIFQRQANLFLPRSLSSASRSDVYSLSCSAAPTAATLSYSGGTHGWRSSPREASSPPVRDLALESSSRKRLKATPVIASLKLRFGAKGSSTLIATLEEPSGRVTICSGSDIAGGRRVPARTETASLRQSKVYM